MQVEQKTACGLQHRAKATAGQNKIHKTSKALCKFVVQGSLRGLRVETKGATPRPNPRSAEGREAQRRWCKVPVAYCSIPRERSQRVKDLVVHQVLKSQATTLPEESRVYAQPRCCGSPASCCRCRTKPKSPTENLAEERAALVPLSQSRRRLRNQTWARLEALTHAELPSQALQAWCKNPFVLNVARVP